MDDGNDRGTDYAIPVGRCEVKVLVTGANGFLGSALVEQLLAAGEDDIRCLVRPGRDTAKLSRSHARFPETELEICYGDLTSREDAARAMAGVGIVYHAAAAMGGGAANLIQNTVVGSRNLLDAITKTVSTRVVLVSSFGVYGTAGLPAGAMVDEKTPLEEHPERRDAYAFSKIRQERLFWEYKEKFGFPLVVLRPGVIYGPGGTELTTRIGIRVFGLLFHFGRNNRLPLTYVDNCAAAAVAAGRSDEAMDEIFNVVDDDLPTSREFLRAYRKNVERLKYITVPYPITMFMSKLVEKYHKHSKGQLPPVLTPYKTACHWKGNIFNNSKLKAIGWRQIVTTQEGIERFLVYWRTQRQSSSGAA